MTREEAVKHIENIIPYVGENTKESLKMAIKALEMVNERRAESEDEE